MWAQDIPQIMSDTGVAQFSVKPPFKLTPDRYAIRRLSGTQLTRLKYEPNKLLNLSNFDALDGNIFQESNKVMNMPGALWKLAATHRISWSVLGFANNEVVVSEKILHAAFYSS